MQSSMPVILLVMSEKPPCCRSAIGWSEEPRQTNFDEYANRNRYPWTTLYFCEPWGPSLDEPIDIHPLSPTFHPYPAWTNNIQVTLFASLELLFRYWFNGLFTCKDSWRGFINTVKGSFACRGDYGSGSPTTLQKHFIQTPHRVHDRSRW